MKSKAKDREELPFCVTIFVQAIAPIKRNSGIEL
jgi:hypothetical protein